MSNPAIEGLSYNYAVIESLDGSKKIDITNSILFVDYFEDILSPCITMSMMISNSTSIYNFLPIRGGERVAFSINTGSGEFSLDEEYSMYVFKVSDVMAKDTKETFTLHLISREGITNETTRCFRRYEGNIKTTVETILKDDLKTTKYKSENIESTSNSYSFIGNTRKPFTVLTWLGPKASPLSSGGVSGEGNNGEAKGTSGYLFYENKDGFNFKSADSLVSNTQLGSSSADLKNIPKYVFTGAVEAGKTENPFIILNYNIEKNIDLLKGLRVGMYSNKTYFYDLYTGKMDIYIYKLKEQIKNTLGTDDTIAVSKELGESWTRMMVRTSDRGVLDKETVIKESGRDVADMAKSASRYNILFTQALNMVVPCNINLKAGDIIHAEFPAIEVTDKKQVDKQQSGNYLIKELRHHFEATQTVTSLKLIRDSYGLYGSSNK
jgi:hypothetical protein